MLHKPRGEWGLRPKAHALFKIASIVSQSHAETQQVELSVAFGGHFIENCLLTIDFCFDGGLRFFSRSRVAEFKHSSEASRDRTPMLSIVTANTANGADRDAVLGPVARREGKPRHRSEAIG